MVKVDNNKYHSECLACRQCGHQITVQAIKTKDGFIHKECIEFFVKSLVASHKFDDLFEVSFD